MSTETDVVQRLVDHLPDLRPVLDAHLADEEGELLPYVFCSDVATWLADLAQADPARAAAALTWLDDEYIAGGHDLRNLIDVGIVEMLPAVPDGQPVLDLLPPALRERAEVAGHFLPREG